MDRLFELSLGTMLKIFMNPQDLQCVVFQSKTGGKYGFMVSRGPGDGFTPLFIANFVFESAEEAVKSTREILEEVVEFATAELENPSNLTLKLLNNGLPFKKGSPALTTVLTLDLVTKIVTDLQNKGVAETF